MIENKIKTLRDQIGEQEAEKTKFEKAIAKPYSIKSMNLNQKEFKNSNLQISDISLHY